MKKEECSHCKTPVVFEGKGKEPEYDVCCWCRAKSCPDHSYLLNPQAKDSLTEVCYKCKQQQLVDDAVSNIVQDIGRGDTTAIDELLKKITPMDLIHYLPEHQWEKHYNILEMKIRNLK